MRCDIPCKQLLIEVLHAARCGNEQEVDKLLADMRQTRKKRIRKGKPMKLSLSSTPIHSPVYDMADDYYAAQHRLPYQWVGAEEEISNRQDESNRVPQYEEFRQFLLRRIQRDYQTYNTNNDDNNNNNNNNLNMNDRLNSVNHSGLIVTRNEVDQTTSIAPLNSLETVQPYSEQVHLQNGAFDYQILDDPTGNGNTSILLRRMLQAPVGADLGEIASPEAQPQGSSCRVWGGAEYNQGQANLLDNSDTLSANSDMNGNEEINNWPIGSEYYKFVNSVRDQLILNPGNVTAGRAFDDQTVLGGQFSGSVLNPGESPGVQYQLLYANQLTDVQPNCPQPWEMVRAAAPFDVDDLNDDKVRNYAAKTLPTAGSSYYDVANVVDYASSRPLEYDQDPLQQDFPTEEGAATLYPGSQNGTVDHCGNNVLDPSRSERKFYRDMSNGSEIYSPQHPAKQINETACNYSFVKPLSYSGNYNASSDIQQQATAGFPPLMQNLSFTSTSTSTYKQIDNFSQLQTTQSEAFNRSGNFGYYTYNGLRKVDDHPTIDGQQLCIEAGGMPITVPKSELAEGGTRARSQNKTVLMGSASTTLESDVTTSLEPFWPQRPATSKMTGNYLENMLNLNTYGYIDYSRIDQTSCIYCYAAPIVTQRLSSSSLPACSQKRRFIAEYRQHTFSPYWLLYDDTRTGMQMSKNIKVIDNDKDSIESRAKCDRTIPADSEGDANGNEYNISSSQAVQLDVNNTQNVELNGNNLQAFQLDEEQITGGFVVEECPSANRCVSEEMSSPESKWPEQHVKSVITHSDSNDRENTQLLPNLGNISPKDRVNRDVISNSAATERGVPNSKAKD
ncbi:myb-like protein AA isoform X2 [Diprion similis]|uniref:myb-like protein AA isoform X2 n=1 Tax=Diprion similis TaxID=362088 RepID=UPI001EF8038A|nr:myb-like protein AA isoform X2 [Diprion similis]